MLCAEVVPKDTRVCKSNSRPSRNTPASRRDGRVKWVIKAQCGKHYRKWRIHKLEGAWRRCTWPCLGIGMWGAFQESLPEGIDT